MKPYDLGIIGQTGPATAPYQTHSATSREAADSIAPHMGAQEAVVLDAFKRYASVVGDGLTDEQCQTHTGLSPSSQRPRRISLVAKNLICDSGLTRLTSSGRKATVWRLK